FTISGPFALDLRGDTTLWSATLHGTGKQMEWRGLPMQETELDTQLSQAEMKLAAHLKLGNGSIQVDLTREGWDQTPLQMSGTLTDSSGKTDEFTATHLGPTGVLTISKLSGDADLFEICRNMPALEDDIPTTLKFKNFPNIVVKDMVWRADDKPPTWTLASLQLRESTEVIVMVREHPLEIERLKGRLSYNDKTWHFDDCQGRMLGGSFALDGYYDGKTLSKAAIALQSLQLAKFKPWVGKVSSSLEDSDLSLTYKGSICNTPARSTGSGTMRLTHAPVVHLPLIDQAFDLFPTLLPHDRRRGTGEFEVAFSMTKGLAAIDPLKARSESVTVTATGTVDLVKRRVSGQARANLRGIAGIATAPLSHVLTEMKVSGPLDDIQVSPITPVLAAKGLITGTVKGASSTVTGSAKLSSNVLRAGLSLPFEALGMFGDDKKASE
ncbi:MAG: AsmA-like C-terminal region, partial [Verrucomicrobiaceae bacterium]|nr:AsmA-like C-terminal region [Verrucomicrobiaceae bacterium]